MENGDSMCVFLNIDLDALFYGFLNDKVKINGMQEFFLFVFTIFGCSFSVLLLDS